jgi:arylsulfatase A-like enzyme
MKTHIAIGSLLCAGLAGCTASPTPPSPEPSTPARPNVLLIMLDDLGYADLGCQGSTEIITPHIDALARSGVRFTAGYVPSSVCGPSRASMLTGVPSAQFGVAGNSDAEYGVPHAFPLIPELLRQAGYATHAVGKWHLGQHSADQTPMARGFDSFLGLLGGSSSFFPFSKGGETWNRERNKTPHQRDHQVLGIGDLPADTYVTDLYTDEAVRLIQQSGERPFFMYLAHTAPHAPLQAPDAYIERNMHIADENRRKFAAMMTAVDDGIGRIVTALKATNQYERTLIVFLSDNGGPTRVTTSLNTPFRGVKGDVWEGGVRVPFMVSWPGVVRSETVLDVPVSSLDLMPTILALAGRQPPPHAVGVDIMPWLRGERAGALHEQLVFWRAGGRAIRRGDIKLVTDARGTKAELFNLIDNPAEDSARGLRDAATQQQLSAALRTWQAGWAPAIAPATSDN